MVLKHELSDKPKKAACFEVGALSIKLKCSRSIEAFVESISPPNQGDILAFVDLVTVEYEVEIVHTLVNLVQAIQDIRQKRRLELRTLHNDLHDTKVSAIDCFARTVYAVSRGVSFAK